MAESTKKLLVDLGLGLAIAIAVAVWLGLFQVETLLDALRLMSDCFFVAAVVLLATGGLTWTKNGGVWDGIGFTFKTAVSRVRRSYDEERVTFAEYREEREKKNSSPRSALIAGVVYLGLALAFLAAYNMAL